MSKDQPIKQAPTPDIVYLSLRQHLGAPSKAVVKVGDLVKKGQIVAEPGGFVSSAVHSPVSGKVKEIKPHPHMMGPLADAVVVENDGKDEWFEGCNVATNWESMTPEQLKEKIRMSGIVGLGGATFPTHVKLSPPPEKKIDSAILNGVECEPYLTADYRLMIEQPDRVVEGFRIIMKVLGVSKGYIGVEANKPDAYIIMKEKGAKYGIEAVMLKVKYPQGAEKQLISAILGREVPSGGLPMDVGCVVQNVGTAAAIYDACAKNIPLLTRIMTVSGDGVSHTANYNIVLGQMLGPILKECGLKDGIRKLVFGGPMMGLAEPSENIPLAKGNSGVLALIAGVEKYEPRMCIRCSRCIDHCPMGLNPSVLSLLSDISDFTSMEKHHAMDCIECGVCTYMCPSRRMIVQQIKLGKQRILASRKK